VFFDEVAQQVLLAQQFDWHAFSLGVLERMHDRAEILTGAAKSAATTATEIMIRFNIALCDSTRHAEPRGVQQKVRDA
jgi:hypothetical protein